MKRILTALACSCAFAFACNAQMTAARMMAFASTGEAKHAPEGFFITFTSGITPSSISLHSSYTGPKTASLALYDSGDGVWTAYTSRTIPVKGNYVAFKGDWRDSAGTYAYMFKSTLADASYTCRFSGAFTEYPTHMEAYREMFRDCSRVTEIVDNPIPNLTGAPASRMFSYAFQNMSSVTSLPENFLNTSGLTGAPASDMFSSTCYYMSKVTSLPENFLNTSGLTGAPAAYMFYATCYNMSKVTSLPENFLNTSGLTGAPASRMFNSACNNMSSVTSLPENFLDTSGLTGAPAVNMFRYACYGMSSVTTLPENFLNTSGLTGAPAASMFNFACYNMSSVTNAYVFQISPNITFTAENVASSDALTYAFAGMAKFPGSIMWGDQNLFTAFTPTADVNTIQNSPLIQGYTEAGENWK